MYHSRSKQGPIEIQYRGKREFLCIIIDPNKGQLRPSTGDKGDFCFTVDPNKGQLRPSKEDKRDFRVSLWIQTRVY